MLPVGKGPDANRFDVLPCAILDRAARRPRFRTDDEEFSIAADSRGMRLSAGLRTRMRSRPSLRAKRWLDSPTVFDE